MTTETKKCHAVLTFGCDSCLTVAKAASMEADGLAYAEWSKEPPKRECPECGHLLTPWAYERKGGKLYVLLVCPVQRDDGSAVCGDQDVEVEIP